MSESREGERYFPSVKPKIAGMAAPRPKTGSGSKEIEYSAPSRPEALRAAALGANHETYPKAAEHSRKADEQQDGKISSVLERM